MRIPIFSSEVKGTSFTFGLTGLAALNAYAHPYLHYYEYWGNASNVNFSKSGTSDKHFCAFLQRLSGSRKISRSGC